MASVKDDFDNIIIQQGLKVRHKESQYEYTVDDVIDDNGITIILSLPEEPRFDTTSTQATKAKPQKAYGYKSGSNVVYFEIEDQTSKKSTIAVPRKEFEKEYEVN